MSGIRVVLAGQESPLRTVLQSWRSYARLSCVAVFTDTERHRLDVERSVGTDVPVEALEQLGQPGGEDRLTTLGCDWLISVGSTVIYPSEVLRAARIGGLNMHPGRLPEYAGLHVHQWAIRNGETSFGATIHWLEPQVDAGDIVAQSTFDLDSTETGLQLYRRCLRSGSELMVQALHSIDTGRPLPRVPQDLSRYRIYRSRDARDGTIDWNRDAIDVWRFIRAADYLPFQSPTYTPETSIERRRLRVRRAGIVSAYHSGEPGTIIQVGRDGPLVVCGDGRCVQLKRIENASGEPIPSDRAAAHGIEPGVCLGKKPLSMARSMSTDAA